MRCSECLCNGRVSIGPSVCPIRRSIAAVKCSRFAAALGARANDIDRQLPPAPDSGLRSASCCDLREERSGRLVKGGPAR